MKERIKRIFTSRIFYVIFSIFASLTIWSYVAYIENPEKSVSVRGIDVEFMNKEQVTERDLVITDVNARTLTLTFTGRRNSVTRLTETALTAEVDLSGITNTGVWQLPYDVKYPIDYNTSTTQITGRSVSFITVTVDKLAKKEVPVRGTYDVRVAEGYLADPIETTPGSIVLSGPQAILARISNAWVTLNRENISKTVTEELPFMLMDDAGHEVVSNMVDVSQETVRVVIPIFKVKEVPLAVSLAEGAGADETNTVITISPSSISLAGDSETLDNLNQILLGTIDLSSFLTATTESFNIILPNEVRNLTGVTTATVDVHVSGLDSRHMTAYNIQPTNVTPGYTAAVVTESLDITLRGKMAELLEVGEANLRVSVDLTELGATSGVYSVLARVYVDGDFPNVGPIGDYKVTVRITKD